METEMNKWCFIKIFSKNTIAPQLWTFSVWNAVWPADKLRFRDTIKKKRIKKITHSSVRSRHWIEVKPVKNVKLIKDENISFTGIISTKHLEHSYKSLYKRSLHLWGFKGSL